MKLLINSTIFIFFVSSAFALVCEDESAFCQFLKKAEEQKLDPSSTDIFNKYFRLANGGSYSQSGPNFYSDLFRMERRKMNEFEKQFEQLKKLEEEGLLSTDDFRSLSHINAYVHFSESMGSLSSSPKLNITNFGQYIEALENCLGSSTQKPSISCDEIEAAGLIYKSSKGKYSLNHSKFNSVDKMGNSLQTLNDSVLQREELERKKEQIKRNSKLDKAEEQRRKRAARKEEADQAERDRKKEALAKLSDEYKSQSNNGEVACYVDLANSSAAGLCEGTSLENIEVTEEFKLKYYQEFGGEKAVEEMLKNYCRDAMFINEGKINFRSSYELKRGTEFTQYLGQGSKVSVQKCNFSSSENTCMDAAELRKTKLAFIPNWGKKYTLKEGERNSNSWMNPAAFWQIKTLPTSASLTGHRVRDLDCNKVNMANYIKWACMAENGTPKCYKKEPSFFDGLFQNNSKGR